MGVTVATTRVACNTGGGTQSITTTDLGGLTPKAAIFIVTRATADGTAADGMSLSYGFATGASNRNVGSIADNHGVGTSEVYSNNNTTSLIHIIDGTNTNLGQADFSAWVTNGVQISWSTNPSAAYLLTVVFFAGTDLSAHADTFSIDNTQDNTVDVTAPGFEPDVLFTRATVGNSPGTAHELSAGVVHNDGAGTITQRCVTWNAQNGQSTSRASILNRDDAGIVEAGGIDASNFDWWCDFHTFDSSGFSASARNAGGNNRDIRYLALSFGGAVDSAVITHSTPTSTGSDSETGLSFTPQFVYLIGTQLTSAPSTSKSGDDSGARMISAITASAQYANSANTEDATGTTNTQSLSDDQAVQIPDDDGTAGIAATFTAFTATGWTFNYTAVKGSACLFWALAIEEEAAGGATVSRNTDSNPLGIHTGMGWRVNTP